MEHKVKEAVLDYMNRNKVHGESLTLHEDTFVLQNGEKYRHIMFMPNYFIGVIGFDEQSLAKHLEAKGIDVIIRRTDKRMDIQQLPFQYQMITWMPTGEKSRQILSLLQPFKDMNITVLEKTMIINNPFFSYYLHIYMDPKPAIAIGSGNSPAIKLTTIGEIEQKQIQIKDIQNEINQFYDRIQEEAGKSNIKINIRGNRIFFEKNTGSYHLSIAIKGSQVEGVFDQHSENGTLQEVTEKLFIQIQKQMNKIRLKKLFHDEETL